MNNNITTIIYENVIQGSRFEKGKANNYCILSPFERLHFSHSSSKFLSVLLPPNDKGIWSYSKFSRLPQRTHNPWSQSQLTDNGENYSKTIFVHIDGCSVDILRLIHPCQEGQLSGILTTSMRAINKMWQ